MLMPAVLAALAHGWQTGSHIPEKGAPVLAWNYYALHCRHAPAFILNAKDF